MHDVSIHRTAFSHMSSGRSSSNVVPSAFSHSICLRDWMSIDNLTFSSRSFFGFFKWLTKLSQSLSQRCRMFSLLNFCHSFISVRCPRKSHMMARSLSPASAPDRSPWASPCSVALHTRLSVNDFHVQRCAPASFCLVMAGSTSNTANAF